MEGLYSFEHPSGAFEVQLRPAGRFFCAQYQTKSSWVIADDMLKINFGKFGNYELRPDDPSGANWSGSQPGVPSNWRKMKKIRPFVTEELAVFDSEWNFEYAGGSFLVEFHADAFNHFVCKQYPAHSHWSMEVGDNCCESGSCEGKDNKVSIDWGKFGQYELSVAPDGLTMQGSARGDPSAWRRATRIRSIAATSEHESSH